MDQYKKDRRKTTTDGEKQSRYNERDSLLDKSPEKDVMINKDSRTEGTDRIGSFKDKELLTENSNLKKELGSIEWSKEESKKISELVLKKGKPVKK